MEDAALEGGRLCRRELRDEFWDAVRLWRQVAGQ
jgi:hypothetical protein